MGKYLMVSPDWEHNFTLHRIGEDLESTASVEEILKHVETDSTIEAGSLVAVVEVVGRYRVRDRARFIEETKDR